MLSLKETRKVEELIECVGRVLPALTVDPPPCCILLDNTPIDRKYFPELYDVTPAHLIISATQFSTPNGYGRFLCGGTNAGVVADDKLGQHSHGFVTGSSSHPNHDSMSPRPATGGGSDSFNFGQEKTDPGNGYRSGGSMTSNTAGDHYHSISFGSVTTVAGVTDVGDCTAPRNTPVPHYMHVGRDSDVCVVFVPGGGWISVPDWNDDIPNWHLVANDFAKRNIHPYRYCYPKAEAGKPSFPAAHEGLVEFLKELSEMYGTVLLYGTSAGANVAALALQHGGAQYVKKFVGLYGVYDLNTMPASFNTTYTDVYLGTTDPAKRTEASPVKPTIPFRLWHSTADSLVPHTQSLNWGGAENTVVMTGQGHGFNPRDAGVMSAILNWLESV